VVIFRPTNSPADLDHLAVIPHDRSVKMPDHLMNSERMIAMSVLAMRSKNG
jgi:hypothetical protein